ncbi:SRPBCC domain-containing protein [Asanoa sp. NPDC049573]|uniref:SRPBCC domain-containing protein n=1 Tax=Asanoa sp. NPDC049573 TaxID=3155396 RepID=UPI003437EF3F
MIRASRATVWAAWTDPARLERWWIPAPSVCRVDRLAVRPDPRPTGASPPRRSC